MAPPRTSPASRCRTERFVAVGDDGATTISPVAWSSSDGQHWTRATVQAHKGDGFRSVVGATDGLAAISSTPDVPGITTYWTSPEGQAWTVSQAMPFGVVQQGEGEGSVNGLFSGDGTRLLGSGSGGINPAIEYATSLDGTHWTRLTLTGDAAAAATGDVTPFLLPDAVLFSGTSVSWFGSPQP